MRSKQNILDPAWKVPEYKLNCYAYGLGLNIGRGGYYKNRLYKARPGDKCLHFRDQPFDFHNCEDIVKRIICDNPEHVRKIKPEKYDYYLNRNLSDDYHLMAAYLSPGKNGNGTDFHFLRRVPLSAVANAWSKFRKDTPPKAVNQIAEQQPPYLFTHRRGWSARGPLLVDASDNLILDPRTANLNYGSVNYSIFCGLFMVATRKTTVTDQFNR